MLDGVTLSGFANNAKIGTFPNSDDRYASFTVRTSEYKGKNPDGSNNYESAWYNCKVYGRLVDAVEANIPLENDADTRAIPVAVHGELRTDTYEVDGQKRKAIYIRVDDIRSAERLGAGMIAQAAAGHREPVSTGAAEPF